MNGFANCMLAIYLMAWWKQEQRFGSYPSKKHAAERAMKALRTA